MIFVIFLLKTPQNLKFDTWGAENLPKSVKSSEINLAKKNKVLQKKLRKIFQKNIGGGGNFDPPNSNRVEKVCIMVKNAENSASTCFKPF